MDIFFVGAFKEKRCTFNVHAHSSKDGSVLLLPFSYAFVNISFSIRNSTIQHIQRSRDLFGIFMDCDFSSESPFYESRESASKVREQFEQLARGYNFSQSAEQNEQRNLRLVLDHQF